MSGKKRALGSDYSRKNEARHKRMRLDRLDEELPDPDRPLRSRERDEEEIASSVNGDERREASPILAMDSPGVDGKFDPLIWLRLCISHCETFKEID